MVIELHLNVSSNSGFLHFLPSGVNYIFVDGIFRVAVPGFLLINGYFFYHSIKSNRYKKWLIRVTLIYIIWMIIYSYFWLDISKPPKEILKTVLFGYWHLWYLNAVVIAGILTYILRNLPVKTLLVISLMLYLIGLFIEYGGTYHIAKSQKIDTLLNWTPGHRNFLFLGFVFFNIGFLINKTKIYKHIKSSTVGFVIVISFILLIAEAYINFKNLGNVHFDNLLFLLFLTPAIFIALLQMGLKSDTAYLSTLATAIYLIHPLFIMSLKQVIMTDNPIFTPLIYLFAVAGGVVLIYLNRRFKYLL